MLLFISDLHLTDTAARSTIDLTRIVEALEGQLLRATRKGIQEVTLVLLGDIFELLKSRIWLDRALRPWEPLSADHVKAVADIFEAVYQANAVFLHEIRRLTEVYPLKLEYLPGNHDLYLNSDIGIQARRRLQELLPLSQSGGVRFETTLLDSRHQVMAKHGHEWDPTNRYSQGNAAIGDAVVIEILLRLPILVTEALATSEDDPRLGFLHELDNVRPQHPRALAHWLLAGLDGLGELGIGTRRVLDAGLYKLVQDLIALTGRVQFESTREIQWWQTFLIRTAKKILKPGILHLAVRLPSGGDSGPTTYQRDALLDLESALAIGGDLRYILCGHTHIHELVPLEIAKSGPLPHYINTGTWRRTHQLAGVSSSRRRLCTFSTWLEECLVCVFDSEEQARGLPSFEVHRCICGRAA
jgi:UDP-2,3-diacylglucosamine pyrophosphatase LpxH